MRFVAVAVDAGHPNFTLAVGEGPPGKRIDRLEPEELIADDVGVVDAPKIITHRSPEAIMPNFHAATQRIGAVDEANRWIGAINPGIIPVATECIHTPRIVVAVEEGPFGSGAIGIVHPYAAGPRPVERRADERFSFRRQCPGPE